MNMAGNSVLYLNEVKCTVVISEVLASPHPSSYYQLQHNPPQSLDSHLPSLKETEIPRLLLFILQMEDKDASSQLCGLC